MLVRIDGDPTYEGVSGTELQRIINTSAFIVCDEAGMHYLKRGDTWMEADGLTGSWSVAGMPPEGADVALASALTHGHINLFTSPADSRVPVVFIATTPAELIVTDGDPEYAPFNGTSLLYVKNTSAVVFKEPTDQELYVHLSSGWFRAWTTNGPWEHVPDDALPADLARLRSVTTDPGTTETVLTFGS